MYQFSNTLRGRVALVTGACCKVGKGIALGLGEAGATVYITGRTVQPGSSPGSMGGTLLEAAEEVTQAGGWDRCACDHTDDDQVRFLFERIKAEQGRLDILVNNVWGGYEHFYDGTHFWEEQGFWTVPVSRWDKSFDAIGVRAHYVASVLAAPMMIAQGAG